MFKTFTDICNVTQNFKNYSDSNVPVGELTSLVIIVLTKCKY